jgi:hypothetical protein
VGPRMMAVQTPKDNVNPDLMWVSCSVEHVNDSQKLSESDVNFLSFQDPNSLAVALNVFGRLPTVSRFSTNELIFRYVC